MSLKLLPFSVLFLFASGQALAQNPNPTSITPNSGVGYTTTFTAVYSDPNGAAHIDVASLSVTPSLGANSVCTVSLEFGAFWLTNDTGTALFGPLTPGSSNTISNSQCALSGQGSSGTQSGNNLSVTFKLTFSPSYAGSKQMWMYVSDSANGLNSGFQNFGTWTVGSPQPPAITSLNPTSGTSFYQSFTATYSDVSGGGRQIDVATIAITPYLGATNACVVGLEFGLFWLTNDAATGLVGPLTPLSSGTISNSQCTVSGQGASFNTSGNNLTFTVPITFNASFSGTQQIWMYTSDAVTGLNSGWVRGGTWTVGSSPPPSFTLSQPPQQYIQAGQNTTASENITDINGFNSAVTFNWTNQSAWPRGLKANFSPATAMNSTSVIVQTTPATPAGVYTLSLSGSGGGVTQSAAVTVTISASDWQPWTDNRLVALDSGDTYAHFATYVTGSSKDSFTNLTSNAYVQAPNGSTPWAPLSGSSTTGDNPSVVDFPHFLLANVGFGFYILTDTPSYTWCCYPDQTTSTDAYLDSQLWYYPAPSLQTLTPAYGSPGTNINATLVGSGLGIADLDVNAYRGITAVNVSGGAITASFNPPPFANGQDVGGSLPVTINIPSNVAPGAYQVSVTAFGYTSNALRFTVADLSPQITAVVLSQPLYPNGDAYVTVYGNNFGSSGQFAICNAGANPCNPPCSAGANPCDPTPDINSSVMFWGQPSPGLWQVNAYLTASANASGPYDIQLTESTDEARAQFLPAPDGSTSAQTNRGRINVGCPTASSVIITTRPMKLNNAFPDTGLPYHSMLTAAGSPSGGTYNWTTDNPSMIQFDNPAAGTVNITVSSSGRAQITVSYTNSCGSTSQDSLTFVLTDDTVVVGWIDGSAIQLPSGASPTLVGTLNQNPFSCSATLISWISAGVGNPLVPPNPPVRSAIDRQYANAFLNKASANFTPPSPLLDPAGFYANKKAYRAFNRFKAYYEATPLGISGNSINILRMIADLGDTPEPCSGGQVLALGAEKHGQNGTWGMGPTGGVPAYVYQLNEGRIGPNGQAINAYLNHPEDVGSYYFMATPYIWSAIQFDASGNVLPLMLGNTAQIFPTYWVYRNGGLLQEVPQGDLQTFISKDWASFYVLP